MTKNGPERSRGVRPEHSRGETLDESIDRVAAALTAVPPDQAFAARLDARLDARSSRLPVWMAVAASAASAVLVAAAVISLDRQPHAPGIDHPWRAAVVDPPPASVRSDAAPGQRDLSPAPQTEALARRPSRRPQPDVIEPSVAAIAGLTTPPVLNVDELNFESLTIAPVEFGHLDLANLEVPEIDAVGDPKE